MRILIMSVTAGEGHNSTAKAMRAYFDTKGVECDILDTYGYVSPALSQSINKAYLWASSHAKRAYSLGYSLAEKRRSPITEFSPSQLVNMPFALEIRDYIALNRPDAIIFTHPFAGLILDDLKKKGFLAMPTVGILTDFTFHPYWEDCTANDFVVMPARALRHQAYRKGFSDGQLRDFGIPIHPQFALSAPKGEARKALGLDSEKKTVLLMGGSMGYGNMGTIIAQLDAALGETLQIIAVCGNNAKARADLERMETRCRLLPLGFVDYVDRLMDAADCIVTKPGGLTTSEALAKRLPMVIVNPIPGQEARNTQFLLNSGAAVATYDMCSADELVIRLMEEPRRLEAMRLSMEELGHPESTKNVCEFVIGLCENRL
ncbi:MAG: galactosyldiacylglycerol synthase [Clostridia bacterium]|nr:galactosyldiacylglycerol synthase [Clostridia bacterium]